MSNWNICPTLLPLAFALTCVGDPPESSSSAAVTPPELSTAASALSWEVDGETTIVKLTASTKAYLFVGPSQDGERFEVMATLCPPDDVFVLEGARRASIVEWNPAFECRAGDPCLPCDLEADCSPPRCPSPPQPESGS